MNQNNLKHDLKRPKDDLQQKKCCVTIELPRWINKSVFSILSAEVFRYVYGDSFPLGVKTPETLFGTLTAESVLLGDFEDDIDLRFFFSFCNRKTLRSESSESSEEFLSSDKESGLYSDSISEDKNSSYTFIFFLFPSSSSSEYFELPGLTGTLGGTIITGGSTGGITFFPFFLEGLSRRVSAGGSTERTISEGATCASGRTAFLVEPLLFGDSGNTCPVSSLETGHVTGLFLGCLRIVEFV